MSESDYEAMKHTLLASLEGEEMAGLDLESLRHAMSHPKAAETVRELLPYEATSAQVGDPAPDFTLPWLPGHAGGARETLTLADHFGKRPVALVFGSYT